MSSSSLGAKLFFAISFTLTNHCRILVKYIGEYKCVHIFVSARLGYNKSSQMDERSTRLYHR